MVSSFQINGQTVALHSADRHLTLLQWLRARGLTGTKEGCAEGECGACAVAFASRDAEGRAAYQSVNSCLVPLLDVRGRSVVTVEGVSDGAGDLHPVQRAMVEGGGSQCGYCTPGFVMSLFCEYYRPGRGAYDPEAIGGNLCRCTGYRPILDAARSLSPPEPGDPWLERLKADAAPPPAIAPTTGSFPHARPASLDDLLDRFTRDSEATLIAGGTDLMVRANQRHERFPSLLSLSSLEELQRLDVTQEEIAVGAGLSLSHLEQRLGASGLLQESRALSELLPAFASRLIRNRATLGGNLATASPIGDAAPALLALDASLSLRSREGERRVALSAFFTGYRQTLLRPGEVIVAVHLPRPLPRHQRFYKVSKRVLDDISTVAAGFGLDLSADGRVERLRVAYAGVAATPLLADSLEALARGKRWDEQTLDELVRASAELGTPQSDHRGSARYRRAMIEQLLRRFFAETAHEVEAAP